MNALRKSLRAILVILTLIQCKEPKPYVITCVDGNIPITDTGGFNKSFRFKNDNMDVNERAMIIQSQIEYNSYLDPTSFGNSPQIDFDSKTLLVGRKSTNSIPSTHSQEVISNCLQKTIDYNVEVHNSASPVFGNAYYYAIIPKISADTKVHFNITVVE